MKVLEISGAETSSIFFAMPLYSLLKHGPYTCQDRLGTDIGKVEKRGVFRRRGLAQGELNGMVSSLGYFVGAASGLVWSRIYSFGAGSNRRFCGAVFF